MKQFSILFIAIILSFPAIAQENKLNIGMEGGPSVIYLRGDAVKHYFDVSLGFSGGLSLQYNFSKKLSLITHVAYERKGAVAVNTLTDQNGVTVGSITQHMNFDYITVPLLLRVTFGSKAHFFLNIGAFTGFLLKAENTYNTKVTGYSRPADDFTVSEKRFDTGISCGMGFSVPIKTHFLLSFELRNNTGLYNVDKPTKTNSPVLKTSSTNLLIGIAYKFGTQTTETK